MKVSSDRLLYLSRMIARKLKENNNLVQRADDETVRRAIVRVLTDSYKELDDDRGESPESIRQAQEGIAERSGVSLRRQPRRGAPKARRVEPKSTVEFYYSLYSLNL